MYTWCRSKICAENAFNFYFKIHYLERTFLANEYVAQCTYMKKDTLILRHAGLAPTPLRLLGHLFLFYSLQKRLWYNSRLWVAAALHYCTCKCRTLNLTLNMYKKFMSLLYSRYYAEACNEWRGPSRRLSG